MSPWFILNVCRKTAAADAILDGPNPPNIKLEPIRTFEGRGVAYLKYGVAKTTHRRNASHATYPGEPTRPVVFHSCGFASIRG